MTSPSDSFLLRNRYLAQAFARPRLLICIALGIASALLLPAHWSRSTRNLIGWNLATWLYIVLVGLMMRKATPTSIRRRAMLTDESRFVVLTLERDAEKLLPEDERGGLRFPGARKPQFVDFLYFSFVIGCASQTADVETTSAEMGVITLLHGVISFFFNTTVLALTINIAAGLI
jgi:uncharacterized membrane protein